MATKFVYEDKVLNFSQSTIQDSSTANTTTWSSAKIQNQLDTKQNNLTFDTTPTSSSSNPVTSAGIKQYVDSSVSSEAQARNSAVSSVETNLTTHETNTNNPHSVTKEQVGLGSVSNLPMDSVVTEGSSNYASSGSVFTACQTLSTSRSNVLVGGSHVSSINFSLSGNTLTITTS